jgi:hypothetical protein
MKVLDQLLAAAVAMMAVAGGLAVGSPPAWALMVGLIVFLFVAAAYRSEGPEHVPDDDADPPFALGLALILAPGLIGCIIGLVTGALAIVGPSVGWVAGWWLWALYARRERDRRSFVTPPYHERISAERGPRRRGHR